jgi:hypothetical protein
VTLAPNARVLGSGTAQYPQKPIPDGFVLPQAEQVTLIPSVMPTGYDRQSNAGGHQRGIRRATDKRFRETLTCRYRGQLSVNSLA